MLDSFSMHEEQYLKLKTLHSEKKLSNSLLFTGEKGIGKFLTAQKIAKYILNLNPERELINHADFFSVDCQSLKAKEVRELLAKLNLTSFEKGARVLVLNQAEQLNITTANIILKSLEEPQSSLYFILVTSNKAKIPITIRSRCQEWHFNALDFQQITSRIKDDPELNINNLEAADLERVFQYVKGDNQQFLSILQNYELWEKIHQTYIKLVHNGDIMALTSDLKTLISDKEQLSFIIHSLHILCSNDLRLAKSQTEQKKYANLLHNLTNSSYYLFDRNINSGYLLNQIFASFIAEKEFYLDEHLV